MSHIKYELRYASHHQDAKHYDTQRLRDEFLVQNLFQTDLISMVYTEH